MQNLDCANCAAKMEAGIKKLDGVNDATISFMTQRLTLDADDAKFDSILDKAAEVCRKVDRDCEIVR
jgi:copper chaperone CopZ